MPIGAKPSVRLKLDRPATGCARVRCAGGTAKPEPQQAAKPDADGISPQAEPGGRQGRNGKRLARPEEAPDAAKPWLRTSVAPTGAKAS